MNVRKELDRSIEAFKLISDKISKDINFIIIGQGPEEAKLKTVKRLRLEDRILFLGKINDAKKLKMYYEESIFSISYGQAGLSVLQALGFGVPFITKKNAISGVKNTI